MAYKIWLPYSYCCPTALWSSQTQCQVTHARESVCVRVCVCVRTMLARTHVHAIQTCRNRRVSTALACVDASCKKHLNAVQVTPPSITSHLILLMNGLWLKFQNTLAGLVETSNNLASLQLEEDTRNDAAVVYRITTSTRSSITSALEHVRDTIRTCGALVGADVEQSKAYPGWNPNPRSAVLEVRIAHSTQWFYAVSGLTPALIKTCTGLCAWGKLALTIRDHLLFWEVNLCVVAS